MTSASWEEMLYLSSSNSYSVTVHNEEYVGVKAIPSTIEKNTIMALAEKCVAVPVSSSVICHDVWFGRLVTPSLIGHTGRWWWWWWGRMRRRHSCSCCRSIGDPEQISLLSLLITDLASNPLTTYRRPKQYHMKTHRHDTSWPITQ